MCEAPLLRNDAMISEARPDLSPVISAVISEFVSFSLNGISAIDSLRFSEMFVANAESIGILLSNVLEICLPVSEMKYPRQMKSMLIISHKALPFRFLCSGCRRMAVHAALISKAIVAGAVRKVERRVGTIAEMMIPVVNDMAVRAKSLSIVI